ncbi:unnamed protein product [Cylindrotheca closterium]|uniref:peptidylprolyl isomerase n=1 Tax=Cylindrotheca closterium TaxID=2856 RepID=A0AAD2FNK2_9STRA|nr:unnamed protein product [Cylindrotheca closterium]
MGVEKRKQETAAAGDENQKSRKLARTRISSGVVPLDEIPTSSHYHVSFMHKSNVTHAISSARHGYVVTACDQGIVKFWKRTPSIPLEASNDKKTSNNKMKEEESYPCLEFCKSYTAHVGPIMALCLDPSEGTAASIGADGLIKIYDVSTFDATSMIKTSHTFGNAASFLQDAAKDLLLAISDANDGSIHIYSLGTLQLIQTLQFHSGPVTALAYNTKHKCCVSCDKQGTIELWDCTRGSKESEAVGSSCSMTSNQLEINNKMKTDLYSLTKKKTYAVSMYMGQNYFVIFGADHKVRVFELGSGKIAVRYDERLSVYEANSAKFGMDDITFGKRASVEREMQEQTDIPLQQLVQLDPSERILMISTMVGIKLIDWKRNKVLKIVGKADASQLRFLSFCLCLGDAKVNQQMQLSRGQGGSVAVGDRKASNDSLIVALSYKQRRFYVFSHIDPLKDQDQEEVSRDVWNEAPTSQDRLLGSEVSNITGANNAAAYSKAILRTTMGDIHIKLFGGIPKTLENFCTHARSGYYDNVIFHRCIKEFMIQTGDPLGDGTGGESIWGGEFEDEFVRELRHDRPFTVSMANAGPNTNGSQYNKHTVFGRVTQGMDVCTMIENVKTDTMDKPLDEIRIMSVDIE